MALTHQDLREVESRGGVWSPRGLTTIEDFTGLALYFVLIKVLIGVPEETIDEALTMAEQAIAAISSAVH